MADANDRKTEDARLVRDTFFDDLEGLRTIDDFREFMIKYFSSHQAYDDMNLLLTKTEIENTERERRGEAKVEIGAIPEFRTFFRDTAYNEFFKKKERFAYEEIQLGFMK